MQDKRARPGTSDYYVHDEEGQPLFRIDALGHDSLTAWLQPIAGFVREVLRDDKEICLCFDRGGAFPEQMATLRNDGIGFVTYERAPYARLPRAAFVHELTLVRDSKPRQPELIRYVEARQKNLGKGRGRVRLLHGGLPLERARPIDGGRAHERLAKDRRTTRWYPDGLCRNRAIPMTIYDCA